MLWIALYLPDLPLQSVEARLLPGTAYTNNQPSTAVAHVIAEGPDTRPVICAVNTSALKLGIRSGHTVAMARALTSTLTVTPRNRGWEREALARVATIACQFTPSVALDEESVLLEVSSSLTLFGGLEKLLSRLRMGMRSSGHHAQVGIAPTPLAALLMARRANATQAGMPCALDLGELPARLADFPLSLFNWPLATLETLDQLGIARIRDLGKLPRGGVARRFGAQIITDLDRALGRLPDPRTYFKPPERFTARVEFMREVDRFEGLRFPVRRLLGDLETFLRARGGATQSWSLKFEHGRDHASAVTIATRQPTRHRDRWEELLCERMARTPLAGEVSALILACDHVVAFQPDTPSWLPDQKAQAGQVNELVERLSTRLGEDKVFGLAVKQDHRPEYGWGTDEPVGTAKSSALPRAKTSRARRPLWLTNSPKALTAHGPHPQQNGPLAPITDTERIHIKMPGTHDQHDVRREYLVALNQQGEMSWIYRDPLSRDQWFLHGHFS